MRQRSARVTVSSALDARGERHAAARASRDGREGVHDVVLAQDAQQDRRGSPSRDVTVKAVPRAVGAATSDGAHVGRCRRSPNQTTRAAVRPAIGATRASSAFSTATASAEQVGHHLGLGRERALDAAELAGVREAHLEHDADVGAWRSRPGGRSRRRADAPISATRNSCRSVDARAS